MNYVLYETQPSCIQLWMLRMYARRGLLFQYNNKRVEGSESYAGAYLLHAQPEQQFRALFAVMEGDFFSLYPTIMIAHNISPETFSLVPTANSFAVNLNHGLDKPEHLVYFD